MIKVEDKKWIENYIQNNIIKLYSTIKVRHNCESGDKERLYITKIKDNFIVYNCFNCGVQGGIKTTTLPSFIQEHIAESEEKYDIDSMASNLDNSLEIHKESSLSLYLENKVKLYSQISSVNQYYYFLKYFYLKPSVSNLYFNVYKSQETDKIWAIQFRNYINIHKMQAKYLTLHNKHIDRDIYTGVYGLDPENNTQKTMVVITEDLLSALCISYSCPQAITVPLLGCTFNKEFIFKLYQEHKDKTFKIWLDNDNEEVDRSSGKLKEYLKLMGAKCVRILDKHEPKKLDVNQIQKVLWN